MPLTIALATAVALAVFVAWPLLASETGAEAFLPVDVTPLADLKRRRMVVYENLQDLEFEYKAGKIASEDYQAMSANYPCCTIEPNEGIVPVPDERLTRITQYIVPQKIVPATLRLVAAITA